jgi:hypothetical protein
MHYTQKACQLGAPPGRGPISKLFLTVPVGNESGRIDGANQVRVGYDAADGSSSTRTGAPSFSDRRVRALFYFASNAASA